MQRRLSHSEKNELFRLFETGKYNGTQLSKIFPISAVAINALLKRNGYIAKSKSEMQRKYKIDESFLDNIDTEGKAYFLGILYADGYNNTDRNSINLSLKESDKDILHKLSKLLKTNKPLQFINTDSQRKTAGFENSQNQYRLVVANKHMSERLSILGCGKAKTHNITFPNKECVPSSLINHFVRGYFDGDGSISGINQKQFSIIGTDSFLMSLQVLLISELGFSKTKLDVRHPERNNNIRSLRYCGTSNCIAFRDWLYKDSTIFMDRKRSKFFSF